MNLHQQTKVTMRGLLSSTKGESTMDGDGVKMTRVIGTHSLNMLDPFLLLDAFESDKPNDYIGGFPSHPHRGFETVTYMLAGRMRHKDSMGNEGVIESHGVQWMTAGRGIVHSEMPQQESGLLKGFQLWVNLPKKDKMCEPAYQEFIADEMAIETHEDGTVIRVIAGVTDKGTTGPVTKEVVEPTYMDIHLPAGQSFTQTLKDSDNAFIFMIEGELEIGEEGAVLAHKHLGILTQGETVSVKATSKPARFLLIAGQPLNESVARGGPFVMNTKQEVLQAFDDYQHNRF